MTNSLRIWIDLANSPHPLLFAPLARSLQDEGHEVLITIRDHAQTAELARKHWPSAAVIGAASPATRGDKAATLGRRARDLARWGRRRGLDVAVSHNSYAQILAARLLGIPVVTAMDFEHQPANHLAFRLADRILLPEALRDAHVGRQGASRRKRVFYPGLKEELYIGDFVPDPEILGKLGIERSTDDVVVVGRTPPTRAIYHRFANPLFVETLLTLAQAPQVRLVVLTRYSEQQEAVVELRLPNCTVATEAVDARSLMYASDLVVGAGGTMTREAALLGIPALSLFRGPPPAVDRWLERRGALRRLRTVTEIGPLLPREAEPRSLEELRERSSELIDIFVTTIEAAARTGRRRRDSVVEHKSAPEHLQASDHRATIGVSSASTFQTPRERVRERLDLLGRLVPRPGLLVRYLAYVAARRVRRGLIRRRYSRSIAEPNVQATLVPPVIDLAPLRDLPPPLRSAALRLQAEAEEILAHRVDVLGSGPIGLGPIIDWHRDFKSGYRWPPVFYQDVEVTRLADSSDAKVPWELSRCHHLLTLARAGRIFEDDRFVVELEHQLADWLEANPPGVGINWTNPMEVALRAVNWVVAIGALEQWRPVSDPLRSDITRSLQVHGRHIAANLEGTPQLRSNHYLADLLGLLVLGASLGGDPAAERWFRDAHAAFEREIATQVHADGVGFEASLPYHALALEMFLVAKIVADRRRRPFSHRFEDRLARMIEASRALRHPDGRFPQIGDSDSGRVLPAGFERGPSIDHLLWIGASAVDRDRPLSQQPHEEVAWTLGSAQWQRMADRPVSAPPVGSAFRTSGFYVLRGKRAHVVVHCGDVGQNGAGGHAHNDLLSFELSYGVPLVVDPGTYAYTSDIDARNLFRSTAMHNTVLVAEAEINPMMRTSLFRLNQAAHPKVELWEQTTERVRLSVLHDGYRRLEPPVVHRRTFSLDRSSDELEVVDELIGDGMQHAKTFLHLPAEATVAGAGGLDWNVVRADAHCKIRFFGIDDVQLTEGWVSDRFGVRERAHVLVGAVTGQLPLRFGYRFEPSPVPRGTDSKAVAQAR